MTKSSERASIAEGLFTYEVLDSKHLVIRMLGQVNELNCEQFGDDFLSVVQEGQGAGAKAVIVDLSELEHLPSVGFYPLRRLVSQYAHLSISIVASPNTSNRDAVVMMYRAKKNFRLCDTMREALS